MSQVNSLNRFKNQKGATLIEAVVALLVFSTGALGIAALQTLTLVRSDDLKQRSVAVWKAQELADRVRATRSIDTPDGLKAAYVTAIGGERADIGSLAQTGDYACPTTEPTRCDDVDGTAAAQCSAAELVTFDIWSVVCDPVNGASDALLNVNLDGNNKLKGLDVVLEQTGGGDLLLYFEWLSRSADQNEDLFTNNTVETVNTDLCGNIVAVDARLETYCLRFF